MSDALEAWLQAAVRKPQSAPHHLAEAMQEDGFDPSMAWTLAAAAQLRYGPALLRDLGTDPAHQEALLALRRHAATAPARAVPNLQRALPDRPQARVLCTCRAPRAALLADFVADEECDALIALARRRLRPDEVIDQSTGRSEVDRAIRSSRGVFFDAKDAPIIGRIEARVAALLQCPVSHLEKVTITRYGPGGEFREHLDCFEEGSSAYRQFDTAGNRIATVVMYLNEVVSGGATLFPIAGWEVHPQRGNALCFWYDEAAGDRAADSLHAGQPVSRGVKWIATVWAHVRPYRQSSQ